MTNTVRAASLIVTVGLTAAVGALSRVPVRFAVTDGAMVRLAWRTTGERIRHCRALTGEELARIPAHMRRKEECSEHTLPYRLEVRLDGKLLTDQPVHAAGARSDRPMYVFEEWRVSPGSHRVQVRFARAEEPPAGVSPAGETPAILELDTTLAVANRRIVLVTYDRERQRLVMVGESPL